ncbi:hypothetical protein H4R21_000880 [Coemansia helicoidea]|uniref:Uncharacterized protein n=1 Tax=Coemansia helicoidea TaxID=1286919 RepID=A0ACC1LE80_9FUNG|nr:hypothetical protein H4R21_000880 [Coemansia helicoidea]
MASFLAGIRSPSAAPADGARRWLNEARLFEATPLGDALDDLLETNVGPEARPRRDEPAPEDYARRKHSYEVLNQYIAGGRWRALALAAEATILETDAGEARAVLRLWTYRALALCGLGHFQLAEREVARLEAATGRTELYRAAGGGRSPTVVWPFELRVLRARLPGLAHGDWRLAIERLSALARACHRRAGAGGSETELNRQRAFRMELLVAGCALRLRDAELAAETLARLARAAPDDALLLSAAARLLLQLGATAQAEKLFVSAERLADREDELVQTNRALYAVAAGRWDDARALFAAVHAAHPDNIAAANNAAVCELYLGRPQAMLTALQQLMVAAPAAAGTSEELVFNYCTGLDLHYDGAKLHAAKTKKMIEVGMWAGDGFDTASFKLQ